MLLPSYTVLPRSIDRHRPSLPLSGHEPEEKLPSPRSGSGALASHSATPIDPSDSSYRNYFTKIQAELSPQKNPVVSNNMSEKKYEFIFLTVEHQSSLDPLYSTSPPFLLSHLITLHMDNCFSPEVPVCLSFLLSLLLILFPLLCRS